jgi:hypothetical protein
MKNITSSLIAYIKLCCLFIVLSFASACASTPEELALLDKSFLLYEHALRWQDYDLVISFHKNEHEKLTEAKRKQLKKYRVTSYEVVYTKVESDHKSAARVVEIKYYNEDYARVRDLTLNQQWEFDDKKMRWQQTNPLPPFK